MLRDSQACFLTEVYRLFQKVQCLVSVSGLLCPTLFPGNLGAAAPSEWGSSLAAATAFGCEGTGTDIMEKC